MEYRLTTMFYRVEAVQNLPDTQEYNPTGEIVMTTRSRRHGDVCRAIYHYLLAGYWVRIFDDDDLLVGGPFRPGATLPIPYRAFARSLNWSERIIKMHDMPLQGTLPREEGGETP